MYLPKSKYKGPKIAGGREFQVKGTTNLYSGPYIETYTGQFFAGRRPTDNGPELEKIGTGTTDALTSRANTLASRLKGFLPLILTALELARGKKKRYFTQDPRTNKIVEVDETLYKEAKQELTGRRFVEVDWNIKGPAEDQTINGYFFEGAESKNRKAIQDLESQMPGISTFITDYKQLVTQKPTPVEQTSETFLIRDQFTELENSRKANFDTKK